MNKLIMHLQFIFILISSGCFIHCEPTRAVIAVPIADLVAHKKKMISLPLAPAGKDFEACPRIFQALFNEQVTILEERNKLVRISVSNAFYETGKMKRISEYWTLKKNIVSFKELKKWKINEATLPSAINWKSPSSLENDTGSVLTLTSPWHDSATDKTYSAGTRFTLATSHKKAETHQVYLLHPSAKKVTLSSIPSDKVIITTLRSPKVAQNLFLNLLRSWSKEKNGIIPYVWGGCSFTKRYKKMGWPRPKKRIISEKLLSFHDRTDIPDSPKPGFDCTGLILRATQIAGIPFFYKNSITITQNLQALKSNDVIEEGDIIWIPGHVMVVSNRTNNLLIEARGYADGYGYTQEIPLAQEFKGVETYQHLRSAFEQKIPLKRLNIKGEIYQTIPNFKILKLSSVWKK